jgi:hypothetical protein
MTNETLADRLYASCFQRVGSDQHIELAGLIKEADRYSLSEDAAEDVRRHCADNPWGVESNMDLIDWPKRPLWIEWRGYLRNVERGENPLSGFLVLPHPEYENKFVVFSATETSEVRARHSYATAVLDTDQMAVHAWQARRFYSKTPDEALERLMSVINVTMSNDFRDEMLITNDYDATVIDSALRDASADIPFFLTVMVAMRARAGFSPALAEKQIELRSVQRRERSAIGRIADRFAGRLSSGIVRSGKGDERDRLTWFK